jgi:hypothetical protein
VSIAIVRTVTASELRDPEVLAEAGRAPIGVYDSRRQDSLVLTSRAAFDADQELHRYMGLLAHAVVELERADPSPVALGEVGYVTTWLPSDRKWWLRSFAEVIATAAADGTTEPIAGFIRLARLASTATPSALEAPIDASLFPAEIAAKLQLR